MTYFKLFVQNCLHLTILLIIFTGCKKDVHVNESCYTDVIVDHLVQEEGEVKLFGSSWLIEVTNNANAGRYLPCDFPEHLKKENFIITFDANVYQTPPNLKLAGNPMIITKIYN